MSQQTKKSAQSATKAEAGAGKSENVVKLGSATVKELLASGASEAKKAQEQAIEFGKESADKFAKSADAACKVAYDALGLSQGNMEAIVECSNLTASFAKDLGSEIFEYANKAFSDNLEISKEIFACRTVNEMVDLQAKIVKNSLDNWFSEEGKLSSMIFEYGSEAAEPLNERIAQANEQWTSSLSCCPMFGSKA